MIDQSQFRKKLEELLEQADVQDKRLTNEQIKEFFAEDGLTEEQMLLVYDFLMSQKIVVSEYYKQQTTEQIDESKFSDEEKQYLAEYTEDLKAMKQEQEGERAELLKKAVAQDALAKSRLIELYLPQVVEIAKELHEEGIYLGDCVQEGNVSLILALDMLPEDDADAFIQQEIRQGILAMMEEHKELKRRDKKMENQVNNLDETLHKMADEKGRGITMSELAEHMKISEDEILDIIKLAGEEMYDKFKEYKDN
jgi:RNA polymerase primary sigma factor